MNEQKFKEEKKREREKQNNTKKKTKSLCEINPRICNCVVELYDDAESSVVRETHLVDREFTIPTNSCIARALYAIQCRFGVIAFANFLFDVSLSSIHSFIIIIAYWKTVASNCCRRRILCKADDCRFGALARRHQLIDLSSYSIE